MSINNFSDKTPLLSTYKATINDNSKQKDQNKNQQTTKTITNTTTSSPITTTTTTPPQAPPQTQEEKTQQNYDDAYKIDEKYFYILEANKLHCHGCKPSSQSYCRRIRE